jgi:uncharacterized Zn-finger protein
MSSPKPTFAPSERVLVDAPSISCNGGGGALGHPRVYYTIGEEGSVECKYCDRLFVLRGGPADKAGGHA